MSPNEYERIAGDILAAVEQQSGSVSAVEMINRLAQSGHSRQSVRATVQSLLDRGQVQLASDLSLSKPAAH